VRVERAGAALGAESPHIAQQLLFAEHARRLGSERSQQRELLVGELDAARTDAARTDADLARGGVDPQLADAPRPLAIGLASPQHGRDPGEQLWVVERLY
jgi:hypothetical protein